MNTLKIPVVKTKAVKTNKMAVKLAKIIQNRNLNYSLKAPIRFGEINLDDIIGRVNLYGLLPLNTVRFKEMVNEMHFMVETTKSNNNCIRFAMSKVNGKFPYIIRPIDNKHFSYANIIVIISCISFSTECRTTIEFEDDFRFYDFIKFLRKNKNPVYDYFINGKNSSNRVLV